jgi:hypothetical protein
MGLLLVLNLLVCRKEIRKREKTGEIEKHARGYVSGWVPGDAVTCS